MTVLYKNNASATISTGINASVTTIALSAGHGARFPSPNVGEYFYATLIDASNNLEIVKVTARVTDTLTVIRGQDGTTAKSFLALDKLELRPTAAGFKDIWDQLDSANQIVGQMKITQLTMSNTLGSVTTRITISTGQCRDSTNVGDMILVAPITKDLTANWVAGTGNGGRDGGTLANAQTWHVHLIKNTTTDVVDAIFSQSPTAPFLPSGFTLFRRLGAVILEASSTNIREFIQFGDWFKLKVRSTDYAVQTNGGGPFLRQISVPAGIKVEAKMYFQSTGTDVTINGLSGIYDPDFGSPPAFGPPTQWAQIRRQGRYTYPGSWISYETTIVDQFTDTSRNVYTYSNDGTDVIVIGVLGWRDVRD